MAQSNISFIVRKDTTSAEIAGFLQQAGKTMSRPDAGLRARQGVGANGKHDGTVVLYVRNVAVTGRLGDRVAAFVDDVKAFFDAKAEYRLAAVTLLERARLASCNEMEFQDGTMLCPILAKVSEGKGKCLTIQKMRHAWQAAFTEEARVQSGAVLAALRESTAKLKGLPDTKQKNGQAPGQVVKKGLGELFYLESLLSVSQDHLERSERQHLLALFQHLGQAVTEDGLCNLKDTIASVLQVAYQHKETSLPYSVSLGANSIGDVERIKDAIQFARQWVNGCVTRPERSNFLRFNHIRALDYLACMILKTYQPESEESSQAHQLLQKITDKKSNDFYRSIQVVLEPKFVDWLRQGKPAYAFFAGKSEDMQWRVNEAD